MTTKTTTTIQKQTFGVEVELTGITRENAAEVIGKYFNSTDITNNSTSVYDTWTVKDNKNRSWKLMRDGSIVCERKNEDGEYCGTYNDLYSCEMVTPILHYEDINTLKEVVMKLVEAGAKANGSTGIHVHVGANEHTAQSLATLLNLAVGREELLYEALGIGSREFTWCHKTNKKLAYKAQKASNLFELEKIWYSKTNDGYSGGINHNHYNKTRYHGVNLHSFFTDKGVEFRYFNGTTEKEKIEAYIQLCLGINVYAINNAGKRISSIKKNGTNRQKMDQMYRFLQSFQMGIREYGNLHKQLTAVWAQ